jgi:L-lactate dehydrogenase complex protein LldG
MLSATPSIPTADLWRAFTAKATAIGAMVEHADDPAAVQALAACESGDVVARGLFAVAETGSVLVREENATRGACMLAERLWLLVPADAIVPTLDEAMARIAGLVRAGAPYVTLMSGPSRTADIERTLTIGVHGPRALTIVVVGGGA